MKKFPVTNLYKRFILSLWQPLTDENDIYKLIKKYFHIAIPDEYLTFITLMADVELKVMDSTSYIRIWGAAGCSEMNAAYHIQDYIPHALAIGDDEGGKVIFYAEGKEGFGLYLVGFGNLDLDDALYIAPSLEALLIEGIGAEIFLAA
ncbi:SMI1/KNR4 family protein [Escherichia fergusonii]|uniref:SMI1/KNR4 family protein n=1 Tax=Escherichia fergusonii TaxID=564 RepID=UPI002434027E|nr:SMI1/KNR4 family protein [Escherichia fergusonii]WGA66941.1 SMI1/KNR4 family protein [Escherichia fergusonii]